MYQKIEISDFKSLKEVSVNTSLITLFVGANSSGKSSVLQALTLLRQSVGYGNLQTEGPIMNLGKSEDLISKGSNSLTLGIFGVLPPWKPFEFYDGRTQLKYGITWKFGTNGQLIAVLPTVLSRFVNLEASWSAGEKVTEHQLIIRDLQINYQAQPNISMPFTLTSSAGHGEQASIWKDVFTVGETIQRQLNLTFNVPPFRGQDLPSYDLWGSPELQLTSTSGSVDQATRLASTVAYNRQLEEKISNWIERITGVRVSSELVPGRRVTIRAHPKQLQIRPNIVNEGYGSNQLVHLMTQIALAPEGSTICIDDPEIHLHPRAQAELAELFVEIAKGENKQLLMTTHSEHILFRLLTTVAEKKLDPSQLSIYYFDKINGWTKARHLRVDDRGTLEEGLPGFFEADVGEFRKYIEAISQKPNR